MAGDGNGDRPAEVAGPGNGCLPIVHGLLALKNVHISSEPNVVCSQMVEAVPVTAVIEEIS